MIPVIFLDGSRLIEAIKYKMLAITRGTPHKAVCTQKNVYTAALFHKVNKNKNQNTYIAQNTH